MRQAMMTAEHSSSCCSSMCNSANVARKRQISLLINYSQFLRVTLLHMYYCKQVGTMRSPGSTAWNSSQTCRLKHLVHAMLPCMVIVFLHMWYGLPVCFCDQLLCICCCRHTMSRRLATRGALERHRLTNYQRSTSFWSTCYGRLHGQGTMYCHTLHRCCVVPCAATTVCIPPFPCNTIVQQNSVSGMHLHISGAWKATLFHAELLKYMSEVLMYALLQS